MNACGTLISGLVSAGSSLLSLARSTLFGEARQVEDLSFFDNTTMPMNEATAVAAKMEQLLADDSDYILRKSIDPNYVIPLDVTQRFQVLEIMDANGAIDPSVTKFLQNVELSIFHIFGGGAAARGAKVAGDCYESQVNECLRQGDIEAAKELVKPLSQARKDQEAMSIRSYKDLFRYGYSSISDKKD